jgi:hypothetical protein
MALLAFAVAEGARTAEAAAHDDPGKVEIQGPPSKKPYYKGDGYAHEGNEEGYPHDDEYNKDYYGGKPGRRGPKGDTGAQGVAGPPGLQGIKGNDGTQGPQGVQGPPGVDGVKGNDGTQGPQGEKGVKGDKGDPAGSVLPRACLNAVSQPSPPLIGAADENDLNGGLPTVAGFIYRAAITGGAGSDWDAGIDAGGLYNPAGTITLGGTWGALQTAAIGGGSNFGSDVQFTLTYTVGVGYTWVLNRVTGGTPATVSFVRDNGLQNDVRATDYHNAIMVVARSVEAGAASEAVINNLQFTFLDNSGLTPCGTLDGLLREGSSGIVREWIISDSDLSQTSWELTGRVRINRAVTDSVAAENSVQVAIYTVPLVNKVFTTCGCLACPAV